MAALVAAGALVLSGCGTTDTAAVVDGRVISEQAIQTASTQYNEQFKPQQPLTTDSVLNWLIWSPSLLAEAKAAGQAQSQAQALAMLANITDPDPATVELVQAQNALNAIRNDSDASKKVLARIGKLTVTVNPRYGTFDPQSGLLSASVPNWLPATKG
jgi:hypothetical protein